MWGFKNSEILKTDGTNYLIHFTENTDKWIETEVLNLYVVCYETYRYDIRSLLELDSDGEYYFDKTDDCRTNQLDFPDDLQSALAAYEKLTNALAIINATPIALLRWSVVTSDTRILLYKTTKQNWGDKYDGQSLMYEGHTLEFNQPDFTETADYFACWLGAKPVVIPLLPPCCMNCQWGFRGNHGDEPLECEHFGYIKINVKCDLWKGTSNYLYAIEDAKTTEVTNVG